MTFYCCRQSGWQEYFPSLLGFIDPSLGWFFVIFVSSFLETGLFWNVLQEKWQWPTLRYRRKIQFSSPLLLEKLQGFLWYRVSAKSSNHISINALIYFDRLILVQVGFFGGYEQQLVCKNQTDVFGYEYSGWLIPFKVGAELFLVLLFFARVVSSWLTPTQTETHLLEWEQQNLTEIKEKIICFFCISSIISVDFIRFSEQLDILW